MGYHQAGFTEIVGVDLAPMPRYPFEFVQADALEYVAAHGHEFDAIHASPPCQGYSSMRHVTGKEYPLLIEDIRSLLQATGKPYVIENVEGAPLDGLTLCGTMFDLKVFRHRIFESSVFMLQPPHIKHSLFGIAAKQGRPPCKRRQYMTITGHFSDQVSAKKAMGIDWMNRGELAEAIPPAYTEWIGQYLIEAIGNKAKTGRI